MGALPIPEPIGLRYAPYIQELREFFAFSGLKFGSPDDIFAVIERIQSSPAFVEDLTSLVRAAILREGGSMPQGQLLEILAVAVGGTEMEHAPQTHRQSLRQLLAFLTSVLRRPWNLPPGERSEVLSFPSEPQLPATDPPGAPLATAPPSRVDEVALIADAPPAVAAPFATAPPSRVDEVALIADAPPAVGAPLATVPPSRVDEVALIADAPPAVAAPFATAPPLRVGEDPSPALAPLAAAAFAHPEPPQPQPVPRPILREAFALKPILATDLPPAPPKPKPQPPPPTLEVRFEPPVDPEPEPLPQVARSLEPAPQPQTAAAPPPIGQAEHRFPTSAPWVAWNRPPKHPESQPAKADSPVEETPESLPESLIDPSTVPPAELPPAVSAWLKRIPRLSRSMHEVVTVGAVAAVIAVLVAVALRPGSSLQSEMLPASSPDLSTSPSTNPGTATPAPVPPAAAEPAKPTADGPELAIPAATARKSRSGGSYQEYIAPPTVRYYNGWGPASQPAANQPGEHPQPVSGTAAPASPSAGSAEQSSSAAPIERRSDVLRAHTADIGGQHYFAVPPSVMAENLVSAPKPDYPLLARIAHVEGKVVVEGVIDRDGSVSSTHVVSGHRLLRGAAVSALRRRHYRPYRVDGHAVDVATTFAVNVTPRR